MEGDVKLFAAIDAFTVHLSGAETTDQGSVKLRMASEKGRRTALIEKTFVIGTLN